MEHPATKALHEIEAEIAELQQALFALIDKHGREAVEIAFEQVIEVVKAEEETKP